MYVQSIYFQYRVNINNKPCNQETFQCRPFKGIEDRTSPSKQRKLGRQRSVALIRYDLKRSTHLLSALMLVPHPLIASQGTGCHGSTPNLPNKVVRTTVTIRDLPLTMESAAP
ncbi:hypothetical protein EMCRGX_G027847 [Ephydatia muelleri]